MPHSDSELCREFGISRPTGRKWRDRYLACGTLAHLGELSRRPHSSPRRSAPERERQVLELRQRYGWGARKLQRLLQESGVRYPATTVHRILKRHGLVNVNAPRPALQRFERPRPIIPELAKRCIQLPTAAAWPSSRPVCGCPGCGR